MSDLPLVRLFDQVGLALILDRPTGIVYTNQTGGTGCLGPRLEGLLVPLGNDSTTDGAIISPENDLVEYFTGPPWLRRDSRFG